MNALLAKITQTLSTPAGRVMIATYTKRTVYTAKHLALFTADAKSEGVFVQHGQRRDYVFPQYVFFGTSR